MPQVTTKEKGQTLVPGTDICKTQVGPTVVPIPYPNIGMTPSANPVTKKIFVNGQPGLNKKSKIKPTNGDQAGAQGGAVSGKIMGDAEFVNASTKVTFEDAYAVFMGNSTKQNKGNAVGSNLMPSQLTVIVNS